MYSTQWRTRQGWYSFSALWKQRQQHTLGAFTDEDLEAILKGLKLSFIILGASKKSWLDFSSKVKYYVCVS